MYVSEYVLPHSPTNIINNACFNDISLSIYTVEYVLSCSPIIIMNNACFNE